MEKFNKEQYCQDWNIIMDLAIEAHELLRGDARKDITGVEEAKEEFEHALVTTVNILNEVGEKRMGKPRGSYITIESPHLRIINKKIHQEISKIFAAQLSKIIQKLQIKPEASVLLVGLGNWEATPDALGPKVVNKALVTRHLHKYAPEELKGGLRPVSALSPGVLGITGIETAEIIKGVTEHAKPDLIIAVDALAAYNIQRVCATIQLSDTGINPGSGVGNKRAALNKETMGVPVIAIGVPTVVNAAVIIFEAFQRLFQIRPLITNQIQQNSIQDITKKVLEPFGGNLTVTPKEIDELIQNISIIIAAGINQSLHPQIEADDFATYLQ